MRKDLSRPVVALTMILAIAGAVRAMTGATLSIPISIINSGGTVSTNGSRVLRSGIGSYSSVMSGGTYSLTPGPLGSVTAARADTGDAHAYPTPFMPSHGHDHITFTALPTQATIRVYTISGELVRTLEKDDSTDSLVWQPVANSYESPLASGVYIFVITPRQGSVKKGKLMVIK